MDGYAYLGVVHGRVEEARVRVDWCELAARGDTESGWEGVCDRVCPLVGVSIGTECWVGLEP